MTKGKRLPLNQLPAGFIKGLTRGLIPSLALPLEGGGKGEGERGITMPSSEEPLFLLTQHAFLPKLSYASRIPLSGPASWICTRQWFAANGKPAFQSVFYDP